MPLFAANLTTMYGEVPFLERFARAAADGFVGVEYLFPYAFSAEELQSLLLEYNLAQALFNAPAGNWEQGERGLAAQPGRQEQFLESIEEALSYAKALSCPRIHIMCGNRVENIPYEQQKDIFIENLSLAADMATTASKHICIEAISRHTMPQYFLQYQAEACAIVQAVNKSNVQVQFDIFHCQMTEGNISQRLANALPHIGHIQIAGVPTRHEPHIGELHYNYIFNYLHELEYKGWVGCEYIPQTETQIGLTWFEQWKSSQLALRSAL